MVDASYSALSLSALTSPAFQTRGISPLRHGLKRKTTRMVRISTVDESEIKRETKHFSQGHFHDCVDHGSPNLGSLLKPRFKEAGGFIKPPLIHPKVPGRYASTPPFCGDREFQVVGTEGLIVNGGVNRSVEPRLRTEQNLGDADPHSEHRGPCEVEVNEGLYVQLRPAIDHGQ